MENKKQVITISPKKKAEELINKFMLVSDKLGDYSVIYYPTAKLHALIFCNEMLEQLEYDKTGAYDFWLEVKKEIKIRS